MKELIYFTTKQRLMHSYKISSYGSPKNCIIPTCDPIALYLILETETISEFHEQLGTKHIPVLVHKYNHSREENIIEIKQKLQLVQNEMDPRMLVLENRLLPLVWFYLWEENYDDTMVLVQKLCRGFFEKISKPNQIRKEMRLKIRSLLGDNLTRIDALQELRNTIEIIRTQLRTDQTAGYQDSYHRKLFAYLSCIYYPSFKNTLLRNYLAVNIPDNERFPSISSFMKEMQVKYFPSSIEPNPFDEVSDLNQFIEQSNQETLLQKNQWQMLLGAMASLSTAFFILHKYYIIPERN